MISLEEISLPLDEFIFFWRQLNSEIIVCVQSNQPSVYQSPANDKSSLIDKCKRYVSENERKYKAFQDIRCLLTFQSQNLCMDNDFTIVGNIHSLNFVHNWIYIPPVINSPTLVNNIHIQQ